MQNHSEIPPDTLGIELTEAGIAVEYTDGREVFYHGVPTQVSGTHETAPGKDIHVLVTDDAETNGALLYVNERKTTDEILEESGVGRILLEEYDESTLFPGVVVRRGNLRFEIEVDHAAVDGRVFVFEEDQFEEHAYELVADE